MMTPEERDDDDNESAIRALNTALGQQSLNLQAFHEDPLMQPYDEGTVTVTPARQQRPPASTFRSASSVAPSDELNASASVRSLTGFSIVSNGNGVDPTAVTTATPAPVTPSPATSGSSSPVATASGSVANRTFTPTAIGDTIRLGGNRTPDTTTSHSGIFKNVLGDEDDTDSIKEELDQLRVSEMLLQKELERITLKSKTSSSLMEQHYSNFLDATDRVCASNERPPMGLEVNARSSNFRTQTSSEFGGNMNNIADQVSTGDIGFMEDVMDDLMEAVIGGCEGYLQGKYAGGIKPAPNDSNKEPDSDSASESVSVSVSYTTNSNRVRMPIITEETSSRGGDREEPLSTIATLPNVTEADEDEPTTTPSKERGSSSVNEDGLGLFNLVNEFFGVNQAEPATSKPQQQPQQQNVVEEKDDMPMHIEFEKKTERRASEGGAGVHGTKSEEGSAEDEGARGLGGVIKKANCRNNESRENQDQEPAGRSGGTEQEHESNVRYVDRSPESAEGVYLEDVDLEEGEAGEGQEVEAFYQRKERMTAWQRVNSHQQRSEWRDQLLKKEWLGVKRLFWVILAMLIIILILLSIVLALTVGSREPNNEPEFQPFFPSLYNMGMFPNQTHESLQDPKSPQHKAYSWLIEDPSFDLYSEDRKMQRFALATLYYATNGPDWRSKDRILTYGSDECQWFYSRSYGRTAPAPCAVAGGLIDSLILDDNNLQGSLPEELFLLTHLKHLSMANNELVSTIPSQYLGKMTNLQRLDFSKTGLSGPITGKGVGKLTNLQQLDLSGNRFTGSIPLDFGYLSNLEELRLQNNGFNGTIPGVVFANLTSLKQLYLFDNGLTGPIPPEMGNMIEVEDLFLCENQLSSSLPSELAFLQDLQRLWLDRNQLTGTIPRELGSLQKLMQLNLHSNELAGTIPAALGNAKSLQQLRLGGNHLTGFVPTRVCALLPADGDNDIVRILSVDCQDIQCNCDCNCATPVRGSDSDAGADP